MLEQDKKSKTDKMSETVAQTSKLQKEIFDACETLDGHAEAIGEEMFNAMLKHHYEQYLREFEIRNAGKLIDVDKELAELKIKRIKELGEIEDERIKIQNELDTLREQQRREFELEKEKAIAEFKITRTKELGEIELKHARAKADIERRREELEMDLRISEETLEKELVEKFERVTPGIKLRRRFLGIPIGKIRYNQAMELALEAAEFSSYEYLMSRAQEIANRKAKYWEQMGDGEAVPDGDQEQSEEVQEQEEMPAEPLSREKRKELMKRLKSLGKDASAEQVVTETIKVLEEDNEDAEPVFVPEPMTEWEKQYYLKKLEKQNYHELKEQRKAEKAERKRLKMEARRAKKLNKKETAHDEKSELEEASASDVQVKIDVADNTKK